MITLWTEWKNWVHSNFKKILTYWQIKKQPEDWKNWVKKFIDILANSNS